MNSPEGGLALEGRRALILGGSGGLGRATALGLAQRGADILVQGGSSQEGLDACLEACRGAAKDQGRQAGRMEGLLLSIQKPQDILERLPSLGTFDILVCAFGPFLQASLEDTSGPDWERLCLLNLALPGSLASALLPPMLKAGWGRMVFFGGTRTDAIRAYATNAAYGAAKTGLGVLVKSLAAEYGGRGLGAFLLCPGFADTEYLSPELRVALAAKAPGGRLIPAESIGEFAADLVAAEPALATGSIINLDQGLKLH